MTTRPSFIYELPNKHFVKAVLSDGESTTYLYPSFLTAPDPLALLIRALISLLKSVEETRFDWQNEPGTWRWKLRTTDNRLRVDILWFDGSFAPPSDDKGKLEFSGEFELLRFAILVRGALRQLLNDPGPQRYEELWGREFPLSEYEKLDVAIEEKKATRG